MDDESGQKRAAADSFGRHSAAYRDSAVHRAGEDLDTIASWGADASLALDVATGAGHTAGGLRDSGASRVIATDIAPEMVATTTASFDVEGVVGDAEHLPFRDETFDTATCRIAAHHFPDPERFVAEVARVLDPGGTFAFEDNVAPEDDALAEFVNRVDGIRDPTHVRLYKVSEWERMLRAAGFVVEETRLVSRPMVFDDWLDRLDVVEEERERITALFLDPPEGAMDRFRIEVDDGGIESFAMLTLLCRATRASK